MELLPSGGRPVPTLQELSSRDARRGVALVLALVVLHGVWDLALPSRPLLSSLLFGTAALVLALALERRQSRFRREVLDRLDALGAEAAAARTVAPTPPVAPILRPAPESPSPLGSGPLSGRRVLLAEDDPEIRQVMKELLTRMGAEVAAGVDGMDAWNLWELLGPFDLLITDQRMPRLNGLELLDRIRGRSRDLPVLVMTGFGLEEASAVLGADPRSRLLAKPFTVPVLQEAVVGLVGAAKAPVPG